MKNPEIDKRSERSILRDLNIHLNELIDVTATPLEFMRHDWWLEVFLGRVEADLQGSLSLGQHFFPLILDVSKPNDINLKFSLLELNHLLELFLIWIGL